MKKVGGYIIILVGLAFLALGINAVKEAVANVLPIVSSLDSIITTIVGIVFIILGTFLLGKKKDKQPKEVPIYEGKGKERKIVGYQVMGEKKKK